jgi:hypothetical protein
VEFAIDGTHAECAAERRGQSPQPRSGAPKAPGLTAPLGRSDDACRHRPFRFLGQSLSKAASRFEPVSVPAIPDQDNLTFGRRTRQPHHNPAYGG